MSAYSDTVVSGVCGDNLTWTFDGTTLTVSGTGKMPNLAYNEEAPWGLYADDIYSVVIEHGVESIGDFSFSKYNNLVYVDISDTVTYIGTEAFCHTALKSVVIPDSVTDVGMSVFSCCKSLGEVVIGDSLEFINDRMFSNCEKLENVIFGKSVTKIGVCSFSNCTFETFVLPYGLLEIGEAAFSPCRNLKSIVLPSTLTKIDGIAFEDCTALYSVVIPDSVTVINSCTFSWCSALTEVTLGNSVERIEEYAFSDCSGLVSLDIPESVNYIGTEAFRGCSSLSMVLMPRSVAQIGDNAFRDCFEVTIFCYPNSCAHKYAVSNGISYRLLSCEHLFTDYVSDNNSTCLSDGTKTACCDYGCGAVDTVLDEGSATGHIWGTGQLL